MKNEVKQLIIIGSGPAGLTAAIYTSRAQLAPLVISGPEPGGQLTLTTEVEDYPGFPDGVQGPELVDRMKKQAERFGAKFISDNVTSVDFSTQPLQVTVGKTTHKAKSVIIATGASARWLGLESEKKFIGRGVSSCAVCDGFFFKEKKVAIIGGGDTALKEALYMAKIAGEVVLIHRRDEFRAQKIWVDRARQVENITFMTPHTIEEVQGETVVTGLKIAHRETGETSEVPVDGVFVAIGHIPNTGFLKGQLTLDDAGYVVSKDGVHTEVPGVFVSGDVFDKKYRQAVTAAGFGCAAAMEAEEWLESQSDSSHSS